MTQSRHAFPAAVFVLALTGGVIGAAGYQLLTDGGSGTAPTSGQGATVEELGALRSEVSDLQAAIQQLQTTPATPAERAPVQADTSELEAQMADLAARVTALEDGRGVTASGATPTPTDMLRGMTQEAAAKEEDTATRIARIQQQLLTATTDDARMQAWRNLRAYGPDAYTDAIAQEMVRMGQTNADASIRADVWRQADGRSTHPFLKAGLLQALASDTEANVREEAAETLEKYCDDPVVRAALEAAANQDANMGVRRYALRSLEEYQEDLEKRNR